MIKRYGDIIMGVVFLIVTALYFQGTFFELKFKLSRYGAEFVPRIYCVIMAFLALGLIVRGVINLRRLGPAAGAPQKMNKRAAVKVMLSILNIVLYLLLMKPLGFVIATALYCACQVLITAPRGKITPLSVTLFAIGVSCALNYLFLHVFFLALPPGLFSF